jgi:hypothetical protein
LSTSPVKYSHLIGPEFWIQYPINTNKNDLPVLPFYVVIQRTKTHPETSDFMSSQTITQTARGTGRQRGRGGNRRRGNSRGVSKPQVTSVDVSATTSAGGKQQNLAESKAAEALGDENEVCWICAEPVKYYSVSDCDHRTCHVCALRLRALYKNTDCTFCKVRYHCS